MTTLEQNAAAQRKYYAAHREEIRARRNTGRRCGPANPRWSGDDILYPGLHKRLWAERGRADTHTCSCGAPAAEWAFDEPTGYSTDLTRYTPMCVPCHRRMDFRP